MLRSWCTRHAWAKGKITGLGEKIIVLRWGLRLEPWVWNVVWAGSQYLLYFGSSPGESEHFPTGRPSPPTWISEMTLLTITCYCSPIKWEPARKQWERIREFWNAMMGPTQQCKRPPRLSSPKAANLGISSKRVSGSFDKRKRGIEHFSHKLLGSLP